MKLKLLTFLPAIFLFISCSHTQQQTEDAIIDVSAELVVPNHYIATKATNNIVIDGQANETDWQSAEFSAPFIDIEGVEIPTYETKMKMLWDDDYLYVYAQLQEPHIWGDIKQRDAVIFYNNDFEVFIDPSGNGRNYGEIEINALGTIWDLHLDKPYRTLGWANNHWDLNNLKSAVNLQGTLNNANDEDSLWSVEMAIPLTAILELKGARNAVLKEGDQWRINFSRVEWIHEIIDGRYQRKKENGKFLPENNWVWSPQKVINMHEPEKWGTVQFTNETSAANTVFIEDEDLQTKQIAYALFRQIRFRKVGKQLVQEVGQTQYIKAIYAENKSAEATYYKTNMGFEVKIIDPQTTHVFIINEDGLLVEK